MPFPKFNVSWVSNAEETFIPQNAGSSMKQFVVMNDTQKKYVVRRNTKGHKFVKVDGKEVFLRNIRGHYKLITKT